MTARENSLLLTIICPDKIGIVADVSRFLAEHRCNIVESAQFEDPLENQFFMRVAFMPEGEYGLDALRTAFGPTGEKHHMQWQMMPQSTPMRTLVMVSKFGHCLNDLVFRHKIGALPIDLRMVVSNHGTFEQFTQANGLPFTHIPVTPETKAQAERQLIDIIEGEEIELIILARYMQVLSDAFCARYSGRIINIHHSLLPSFKGAKPYHRAHERGVKLVGATAHYVTADLDEGPIIEQGVTAVRHNMTPDDLVAKGREVETTVLSTAVQLHSERRVFLNGKRTVVF
tara:strand:- start:21581 stop:22438 length:858 start_codon:yes stop_codon:yes gene_type:complete